MAFVAAAAAGNTTAAGCSRCSLHGSSSGSSSRRGNTQQRVRASAAPHSAVSAAAAAANLGVFDANKDFAATVSVFEGAQNLNLSSLKARLGVSLKDDLALIKEEVADKLRNPKDPVVAFIRACTYERYNQLQAAIEQFDAAENNGMQHIDELFSRRASCNLVLGNLSAAIQDFESAARIRAEALGNQMHISLWFEREIGPMVPDWVGKPFALQRAIALYLSGKLQDARESLRANVIALDGSAQLNSEFGLWELAVLARLRGRESVSRQKLSEGELQCAPDGLCEVLELYREADDLRAEEIITSLEHEIKDLQKSIFTPMVSFYLGLYHSAFTGDKQKRNEYLKRGVEGGLDSTLNGVAAFLMST